MDISFGEAQKLIPVTLQIVSGRGGTNTLLDEARLGPTQAKESVNLIQVQDGLWKTKWGSAYYGIAIPGESTIDGGTEYIKEDGTRVLVAIGGTTGKFYSSDDDGASWDEVTGATFTVGNQPFFLQIGNVLYVTNGVDPLTRYNGTALVQYVERSAPTWGATPLARGAGLSAGSFELYYQVTAVNEVGETVGSTEETITINKERDAWSGATENIVLTWNSVTGATRYQIYISDQSGREELLDDTTGTTYTDDGTKQPNPYVTVPNDNTTGAPKFRQMELSGNRIWATGDPDNPWRVYWSGVGQSLGYFSPFYGGGSVDIELGGRDRPISVVHYRTGKGDSIATVLTQTPEGRGSIWQVSLESLTVGSETFLVPTPIKIVGSVGACSAYGAVKAVDNVLFPNGRGIFALRNKAQMFNVLSTDELSAPFRPSYRSIRGQYLHKICGYFYEGKVFFSAPVGSTENDRTFIMDLERNNWNWYWDKGYRMFFEHTDVSGNTHFLAVPTSGAQLIELSENIANDLGQKFNTSWISGLYAISKDRTQFAVIPEVIFELGRPKGVIKVEVLGIEKKRGFTTLATATIRDTVSNVDFANALFGDFAFSDDDETPTTFAQATKKKRVKVRKQLNAIQFRVSSETADTDYTLLSITAKGTIIPTKPPSSWN